MYLLLLLFGSVILVLAIFISYKIQPFNLLIRVITFISLILYLYLFFLLLIDEERNSLKQVNIDSDHLQIEKTTEKNSDDQISYVKIKEKVLLDAPIIKQFPELPRGCEVTSLAMLLQYNGIETNKMDLAAKITKDPIPLRKENGRIYWGNPNNGFIGDMYSYSNPGYGVYHQPIKALAEQFLPGQIIDLTGREFVELKTYLSLDIPIWVIINTTFKKLPENAFETWETPDGEVKVTYKEHSVLITGYDEKKVYFNDPLTGIKNRSVSTADFIEAWKQMGSQAITYQPE